MSCWKKLPVEQSRSVVRLLSKFMEYALCAVRAVSFLQQKTSGALKWHTTDYFQNLQHVNQNMLLLNLTPERLLTRRATELLLNRLNYYLIWICFGLWFSVLWFSNVCDSTIPSCFLFGEGTQPLSPNGSLQP